MERVATVLLAGCLLVLAGCPDSGGPAGGDDLRAEATDPGPDGTTDVPGDAPLEATDLPAEATLDILPDVPPADLADADDPCPTDFMAADGTPCATEGRVCGGNCTDRCQFCNLLRCEGGRWAWMEAFPDPACRDAGPDAAGDDVPDAPDPSPDPSPDAAEDVPPDLPADAPADAPSDSAPDAPADACAGDACPDPCGAIEAAYDARVLGAAACQADGECQILWGHCGVGLGGCWYAVNGSLSQADLDALSQPWVAQACTSGSICRCPPIPAKTACMEGTCAAAP